MIGKSGSAKRIALKILKPSASLKEYVGSDSLEEEEFAETHLCRDFESFLSKLLALASENRLSSLVAIEMKGEKYAEEGGAEIAARLSMGAKPHDYAAHFNLDEALLDKRSLDLISKMQQLILEHRS